MKIFTLILTECQARNLESFGNDYLKCLGRWPLQTCRNSKIYAWKCEFLACRPRCGLCRLTITPWGPKVDKLYVANDMAISHNTYIRGINAIYLQAEGVKTVQDKKNFLQYCQFWVESFEHHHDAEEEFFFPSLDKVPGMKGLMDINIEQHKSFHSELEKFDKYVRETKPEDFNGKTLKEIIESFADRVVTHLHGEIETLIGLQKHDPDGEEVKKLYLITEKAIIAKAGLTTHFPFVLGCRDVTYEGGINNPWPVALPTFIPYLVSWFFARKYKECWKFAPSDILGKPQPLSFLAES